jgi:hypothetical protein
MTDNLNKRRAPMMGLVSCSCRLALHTRGDTARVRVQLDILRGTRCHRPQPYLCTDLRDILRCNRACGR